MNLVYLIIAAVFVINLVATVAVLRVQVFSGSQRAFQLVLIWLVPVIGAIACLAFVSSQALGPAAASSLDPLYGDGGSPDGFDVGGYSGSDGGGDGCGDGGGGGD